MAKEGHEQISEYKGPLIVKVDSGIRSTVDDKVLTK
jgi:hypothetical protein